MRPASALALIVAVVAIAGCGGGASSTTPTYKVVDSWCTVSSAGGAVQTTKQTTDCTFTAEDGERFECSSSFGNATLTAATLAHAKGCRRMKSIRVSPAGHALVATIDKTQACLGKRGLRANGGPMILGRMPRIPVPVGWLDVNANEIAFYTSADTARRYAAWVNAHPRRFHLRAEPRGSMTISWAGDAAPSLRTALRSCVPA